MFYALVLLSATGDKNKVVEGVVQCTFFKTKSPGIKYDILMKVTLSVIQSMFINAYYRSESFSIQNYFLNLNLGLVP